jgi:putative endonuclease
MKTEKRKLGDFGESIAAKFLMKRGFVVVERNYNRPWGEIDLIVRKGGEFHFVEVKSAIKHGNSENYVNHETLRPEDNIHERKLQRMQKAIQTYCMEHDIAEEKIFIDAVVVNISEDYKKAKVILLPNIVL